MSFLDELKKMFGDDPDSLGEATSNFTTNAKDSLKMAPDMIRQYFGEDTRERISPFAEPINRDPTMMASGETRSPAPYMTFGQQTKGTPEGYDVVTNSFIPEEMQDNISSNRENFTKRAREVEKSIQQNNQEEQPEEYTNDEELAWSREEAKKDIDPEVLNYLEDRLLPETRKYGIPDSLAASQWAIEGARDISESKPNPFGMLREGELLNYGSFEQNVKAYYQTIEGIVSTNLGISRDEFNIEDYTADELLYYLQFQKDGSEGIQRYEAHKQDPNSYIEMNKNMSEWRTFENGIIR